MVDKFVGLYEGTEYRMNQIGLAQSPCGDPLSVSKVSLKFLFFT